MKIEKSAPNWYWVLVKSIPTMLSKFIELLMADFRYYLGESCVGTIAIGLFIAIPLYFIKGLEVVVWVILLLYLFLGCLCQRKIVD